MEGINMKNFPLLMFLLLFLSLSKTCSSAGEVEEQGLQASSDNNNLNPSNLHETLISYNRLRPLKKWIPGLLPQHVASHDQRKPVRVHDTFDQRKPVVLASDHDNRGPVPLDEGHDQRWEVPVEDTHDERSPIRAYDVVTDEKRTDDLCLERYFERENALRYDEYDQEIKDTVSDSWFCLNNSTMIPFSSYLKLRNEEHSVKNFSRARKVCGRPWSFRSRRTVGGKKTHNLRWPWMMSLLLRDGPSFKRICSATLLNEFWAITAAHCVYGKRVKDILVQFLESKSPDKSTIEKHLRGLVIHPEFDFFTYENDLALMKFEEPLLQFQPNTVPVCLPSQLKNISGRTAVVTGWESSSGESLPELYELHVPVITNAECERMYRKAGYSQTIPEVFLCAGVAQGGFDACQGDSGGPMVIKNNRGQWTLIGLISWGIDCAAPYQPGVYTRISKFKDWIDDIVIH